MWAAESRSGRYSRSAGTARNRDMLSKGGGGGGRVADKYRGLGGGEKGDSHTINK